MTKQERKIMNTHFVKAGPIYFFRRLDRTTVSTSKLSDGQFYAIWRDRTNWITEIRENNQTSMLVFVHASLKDAKQAIYIIEFGL